MESSPKRGTCYLHRSRIRMPCAMLILLALRETRPVVPSFMFSSQRIKVPIVPLVWQIRLFETPSPGTCLIASGTKCGHLISPSVSIIIMDPFQASLIVSTTFGHLSRLAAPLKSGKLDGKSYLGQFPSLKISRR